MEGYGTANEWVSTLLRCAGFLGVFFGLDAIGKPLITALGVIPAVEGLANAGYSVLVVLPTACAVSGGAMALGWLRARPWLAAALVFGGCAAGGYYFLNCTDAGRDVALKISSKAGGGQAAPA